MKPPAHMTAIPSLTGTLPRLAAPSCCIAPPSSWRLSPEHARTTRVIARRDPLLSVRGLHWGNARFEGRAMRRDLTDGTVAPEASVPPACGTEASGATVPLAASGLELREDDGGLALVGDGMVLRADLTMMKPRLRPDRLGRELLVRAARIRGADGPLTAVDATAGLGEDALLLAAAGFSVTIICVMCCIVASFAVAFFAYPKEKKRA